MKRFRATIYLLLLLLPFSAFGQRRNDSTAFFDKENFILDTLTIETEFMECGEWGGHLEKSKIYLHGNDFYLNYQKFKTDCSKISDSNDIPPQKLIQTKTKRLTFKDKILIRNYTYQLLNAKFREQAPYGFGETFKIKNSDGSINLYLNTWGSKLTNAYLNFIKQVLIE